MAGMPKIFRATGVRLGKRGAFSFHPWEMHVSGVTSFFSMYNVVSSFPSAMSIHTLSRAFPSSLAMLEKNYSNKLPDGDDSVTKTKYV